MIFELPPVAAGVAASVFAGAVLTALGAVPVFAVRALRPRTEVALLGFAAGVMLAATFFSLLLPALALGEAQLGGRGAAVVGAIAALFVGALALQLAHRLAPHEHLLGKGREGGTPGPAGARIERIWLFVIAITIHNVPEGLSVGVAAGSGDAARGLAVMTGIGLQNMPEGLAVAVALRSLGYAPRAAFAAAAFTGLVEPIGGVIGAGAVALSTALLPWALAFSAGAMLFVISDEIIPETHRPGTAGGATASLFAGFAVMMLLDATLG